MVEQEQMVNKESLAHILSVTPERIDELISKGIIDRPETITGKFNWLECAKKYLQHKEGKLSTR